ncbi:LPXTG cell wall anchor domain-containing protein [Plantactinospora sonchi]|uniref:LPXTG cell wall anchor domain-containing protein n=1 Tax=Plantactinospora sonchi TaxID=1544735 RepID=A0ABU7RP58_9ACTN
MPIINTRRVLAGLGVAGALVAAAPSPAQAADLELDVYFPDTVVALDHPPGTVAAPILFASEEDVVYGARLTYDLSDLTGKVTVTETGVADWCEAEGTKLVCTPPGSITVDPWGSYYGHQLLFHAADGAALGDEGTLKVTFEAQGSTPVSHEATITVGEGVDLVAGDDVTVMAEPGARFAPQALVTNASGNTVKGTALVFQSDYAVSAADRFSNCYYDDDTLLACVFDNEIEAGLSYGVEVPLMLRADTEAPGNAYSSMTWLTRDEFEEFRAEARTKGATGGGKELELRQMSRATARAPQIDTNPLNNSNGVQITVTGKNAVDLAAIGDSVTGAQGDEVKVTVGVDNPGPATADASRSGIGVTNLRFTLPTGTSAVAVPNDCVGRKGDDWGQHGKPHGSLYRCDTVELLKSGERQTFEFTLRIDEVVANATGKVEINYPCECEGRDSDADKSNDTAKILVNATEGGGGAGEGLPVTGTATGLIAAGGAALLAAGVVGFVLARRRRTRFVA